MENTGPDKRDESTVDSMAQSGYRRHILVIRLSAFGDVAVLQPVLRHRAEANLDTLFTLAGPPRLAPLFEGMGNVHYLPTPRRQKPRELYRQLAPLKSDTASGQTFVVADMHHVLRTIGLDWLFRLHGVTVHTIRKHNKPVRPTWRRYDEVFDRCGLKGKMQEEPACWQARPSDGSCRTVGIAPFAQHEGKRYPLPLMERVVEELSRDSRIRIQLYGSPDEAPLLQPWMDRFPRTEVVAGRYTFEEELRCIAALDVMISMDSSNMHFASALGVPVISIWGATHPGRGFYGWRQNPNWAVQLDMPCRPCSRYGNKPCRLGGYPCLAGIKPEEVVRRTLSVLGWL